MKTILDYLTSMQTTKSINLKEKYNTISKKEGYYGTRPAIHVFTFDIEYNGHKFSARGCHTYTYPNFETRYGKMEEITELELREHGHGKHISSFVFTKDAWIKIFKQIKV
jgi:hypothetical protein